MCNDRNVVSVLSVVSTEIFASKIVAILNLTAARDLYDIYNLLKFGLIDQVTQNRIKSAQPQVKTWLESIIKLEDNEYEFLNAFRNNTYRPELLFESNEILKRVRSHPMALWMCSQK